MLSIISRIAINREGKQVKPYIREKEREYTTYSSIESKMYKTRKFVGTKGVVLRILVQTKYYFSLNTIKLILHFVAVYVSRY